jgi:hypothetical protein
MRIAPWCVAILAACSPVVLGEEARTGDGGGAGGAGAQGAATGGAPALEDDAGMSGTAGPRVSIAVAVRAIDCGACFELLAAGAGGTPPYDFTWSDGSTAALRNVCVAAGSLFSVVARDAAGSRSEPHVIELTSAKDAGCAEPVPPTDAARPAETLCLDNPSFEGTPAISFGDPMVFDADPWSLCSNNLGVMNAPDIGNAEISQTATAPDPVDGNTYLALGEQEQVSQELCGEVTGDVPLYLEIDLARIAVGEVVPGAEQIFLEIWGGLSADCSQRELLWASRALTADWQRFCVALRPRSFTTQLTLRGGSDMASNSLGHVLVDNLRPVDSCP